MNSRLLFLVVALVAAVIGVDAVRRHRRAPDAPPPMAQAASPSADGTQPAPNRVLGPLPGINDASTGTPTLDLMARLAIRRRLDREGGRVYLDSLLANTDSLLVRWADRGDSPLTIAFVRDTSLPGWSDALLDEVRAGLQSWDGNPAGLRFREAAATDSADIKVRWVAFFPDSGKAGVTTLSWSADGEVHSGEITLALQDGAKHAALPSSLRKRVASHEIGHALGLPHSADRDDLMFPSAIASSPSRRDQATLQLLYSVPPGSIRVPQ